MDAIATMINNFISNFVAGFNSLDAFTATFFVASALAGIASGLAVHNYVLPKGMVLRVLGYEVATRNGQDPGAA